MLIPGDPFTSLRAGPELVLDDMVFEHRGSCATIRTYVFLDNPAGFSRVFDSVCKSFENLKNLSYGSPL